MSYRTTGRGLFDTHLYFYLLAPHPALRLLSAATGTRYKGAAGGSGARSRGGPGLSEQHNTTPRPLRLCVRFYQTMCGQHVARLPHLPFGLGIQGDDTRTTKAKIVLHMERNSNAAATTVASEHENSPPQGHIHVWHTHTHTHTHVTSHPRAARDTHHTTTLQVLVTVPQQPCRACGCNALCARRHA